jgi:hypothetical protein
MGTPSAPTPPPAPQAPNYAQASREAIQADIDTLPLRRAIELQARKKDLEELAPLERQNQLESALATARAALEVQRQYGRDFNEEALRRIAESDPAGFAARQLLAQRVYEGLLAGPELDAEFVRQLQQQVRGAQAARGNILGTAPAREEADVLARAAQAQQQQRLANASSYVFGAPLTAQYDNVRDAQQGAAPFSPQPFPRGIGPNPQAGSAGASYAQNIYEDQVRAYNSGLDYLSDTYRVSSNPNNNPWLQGLGLALSGGRTAARFY